VTSWSSGSGAKPTQTMTAVNNIAAVLQIVGKQHYPAKLKPIISHSNSRKPSNHKPLPILKAWRRRRHHGARRFEFFDRYTAVGLGAVPN